MTIFDAGGYADTITGQINAELGPHPRDFGAVGDGVADDTVALQAFFDHVMSNEYVQVRWDGKYLVSAPLNMVGTANRARSFVGNITITGGVDWVDKTYLLKQDDLDYTTFKGKITLNAKGSGTFTWASGNKLTRVIEVGLWRVGSREVQFLGGIEANGFAFFGVFDSGGNNSLCKFGRLNFTNCGSGPTTTGYSLTANWSTPVNSGSASSSAQRTKLTVDIDPPDWVLAWKALNVYPVYVAINGEYYNVKASDAGASTIDIFPWLDAAQVTAGTGTLAYIFGGGLGLSGIDDNVHVIDQLDVTTCGIGLMAGSFYEPAIRNVTAQLCGFGVVVGEDVGGDANLGGLYNGLYMENNRADVMLQSSAGRSANYRVFSGEYAMTFNDIYTTTQPRDGSNRLTMDNPATGTSFTIQGQHYQYRNPIKTLFTRTITANVADQPSSQHFKANTMTVKLVDILEGSAKAQCIRLLGHNVYEMMVFGTGTSQEPTGTVTFNCVDGSDATSTTWTLAQGGTTVAYNTFTGPTRFTVYCDFDQYEWYVHADGGSVVA